MIQYPEYVSDHFQNSINSSLFHLFHVSSYRNPEDRVPSRELRERARLGIDDVILTLQQNRLQWYGHML